MVLPRRRRAFLLAVVVLVMLQELLMVLTTILLLLAVLVLDVVADAALTVLGLVAPAPFCEGSNSSDHQ